ncbi:UNVERIFIED_CONTAM: hypothetical protein RMT77_008578 [Armadillidium vulgare]
MSVIEIKLCTKLLNEYFGSIVAEVGKILMKKGCNSLKYLCAESHLPRRKVQEALCVLIKHNLVTWDKSQIDNLEYTLLINRVLLFLRFPKYILLIRNLYGEEAEMVVDILLKEGQATVSQIIIDSALKLLDATDPSSQSDVRDKKHIIIRNVFENLITNEFIQKCPNVLSPTLVAQMETANTNNLSSLLDLKLLQDEIRERRLNPEQNNLIESSKTIHCHPDKDIYWRLNYDRFHLAFRDIEMEKSISRRIDENAAKTFTAILQVMYKKNDPWVHESNTILASEVRDRERDLPHLDQYLKIIGDCGGKFLRRVGDAGGGEYVLETASLIQTITMSHIDNIVRERYGSNAARIFRLVRENGMLEQNLIAKKSMLSSNEANFLIHNLLKDNFFRIYELRKGATPTPASKNYYLFFVEVPMVVRMILTWAFSGIYNLMEQRNMRHFSNNRLLERKARVEMIVDNLKRSGGPEEQIQEVEDMFSEHERQLVKNVLETEDTLYEYESDLDDTIFLMQMYLYYEAHMS